MRTAWFVVMTLAVLLLAATAVTIVARLTYGYELEWLEGATLVHVARIVAGAPLYAPPSLEFVAFGYPPLYYYVCAPLAALLGPGFLPLRLVSATATVIASVCIFGIVRRETCAKAGIVAAAVFAGTYPLAGGWLDLGRVDALYIALLALAWLIASRAETRGRWILAATCVWLAFLAKQPALIAFAPIAVYLAIVDRRAAAWFVGTIVVLAGASFLFMNWATDGWYSYYVFELPRKRLAVSSSGERLVSFWTQDMLSGTGIAFAAGIISTIVARAWRVLALAAGFIGSAWMSRLEGGAWINVVLPAYLTVAILLGLFLRTDLKGAAARIWLAAIQLALLLYDPRALIPMEAHSRDGAAFVQSLRTMSQPVLVLNHNFYATLAGLPEFAHGWAITDVVWSDRSSVGLSLEREIRAAIRDRRFGTIVLDRGPSWFLADIQAHYRYDRNVIAPAPLSGAIHVPELAYVRR